jgi:hypothetical protein
VVLYSPLPLWALVPTHEKRAESNDPSNLTTIQQHSSLFIAHFSYILLFVENKLETITLEIWETKEDKQLSVNKLKEKYIEYVRSHFIKTPHLVVVNQHTNGKFK